MGQAKRKVKLAQAEGREASGSAASHRGAPAPLQWGTGHLAAAFAVGIAVGAALVFLPTRNDPAPAAPPAPSPAPFTQEAPAGVDRFGRASADEHFGHDHP